MTNRAPQFIAAIICLWMISGCQPQRPNYRFESADLNYYVDQDTEIAYPDIVTPMLNEVTQSRSPITNAEATFDSFWDLGLEDSVHIALQNSKVIRGYGTPGLQNTTVAAGVDNLSNGPNGAGTIYDVSIRETEAGFIGTPGQIAPPEALSTNTALDTNQGVEAALAEFDTQLTSNLTWNRGDQPRNVIGTGLVFTPSFFQQDLVGWTTQIAKKAANGTQFFARSVNSYTANTIPTTVQPLTSVYQTALEFEIRQPLLRGRGTFINRIPIVVSRINTDQIIANYESVMQNMVTNVEIRYWDLHCAYRNLQAAKDGRDGALVTWRNVYENFKAGKVPLQDESQARGQYYFFRSQVEQAWVDLLQAETNFRWLLGVASNDGRLVRPTDEPSKARVNFDYTQIMDEALTYRPELRQTRWEVKKRELAVHYSKNALLPSLNASALYRWLGLGDDLINYDDDVPPFPNDRSGALNELLDGDFQEIEFSLDFGLPVGFRRELANMRNAQLKLARELARIEDQELDVEREVTQTLQAIESNYAIAQTSFNSWAAYSEEVEARKRRFEAGTDPITFLLDAQRSRSQGESAYYLAICEYNKAIALMHRRKGTILAYNNIFLTEGPWPNKAYDDANENARRRSASREINYGFTRPQVISQGPIYPPAGQGSGVSHGAPITSGTIYDNGTLSAPAEFPIDQNYIAPESNLFDAPSLEELPANPTPVEPEVLPTPDPIDAAPTDTRRLRNQGQRVSGVVHPVAPTKPARSQQTANRNVDWQKFGMSRPDVPMQSSTRATIRQVNHEEAIRR